MSADAVDYRNPDYSAILAQRAERLGKLRADPQLLRGAKVYYRTHPWDFVADWGMTYEPRNIELGRIPYIPFIPWPRQVEFLKWLYAMWKGGRRGLVEKSRDCGVTWLSVGFDVCLWLHEPGYTAGYGSRKEELVDKRGDEKAIFEKIRIFIDNLPKELLPATWSPREHSAHMRVLNADTGAAIIGEAGDNIGRGGRTARYTVDEAAFVERQDFVDAALSANTNCQIDISSVNGSGNAFYRKRMRLDKTDNLFIFDWRQDPRKDEAWYAKKKAELDPVIVAAEIDRDYNASSANSFIPGKWVAAAIDAHKRLGIRPQGLRVTGFDPADVGDAKACVNRHGPVLLEAKQLKEGDITQAIPWAFDIADAFRADILTYDGDGMGAPTMKLALLAQAVGRMSVMPFHGSGAVQDADKPYSKDPKDKDAKTNGDAFQNFRAQAWTWARERFEATFEAIQRADKGWVVNIDPDQLISIDSGCEALTQLQSELSRPQRLFTNTGKIKVESKADMKARDVDSPNLADAAIMALATRRPPAPRRTLQVEGRRMLDPATGF